MVNPSNPGRYRFIIFDWTPRGTLAGGSYAEIGPGAVRTVVRQLREDEMPVYTPREGPQLREVCGLLCHLVLSNLNNMAGRKGGARICEANSDSRCHRLNKQCVPAPHTRKRGDKRRTRTADLEEKIEDLVTLLKTRTGDTSTTPQVPPAGAEPACFSGPGQPTPSPSAAPTPEGPYLPIDLSSEEEAMCLELFRTEYLAYFPFVHIPDGTTPRSFKASRPVLWLVVVGLTCRSTARRVAAMGRVEEVLAGRIVVGHERGVDVLLGIVAVLGW